MVYKSQSVIKLPLAALALSLTLLISACGSGSGSTNANAPQTPTPQPKPRKKYKPLISLICLTWAEQHRLRLARKKASSKKQALR